MTAKRVGYGGSSQCQLVGQFHVGEMDEKLPYLQHFRKVAMAIFHVCGIQWPLFQTIINHSPNHHFYRWYKPFPNGWFIVVLPILQNISNMLFFRKKRNTSGSLLIIIWTSLQGGAPSSKLHIYIIT